MASLSDILNAVYINNPTLKSFLRVIQFFAKSPNKLGIAWKDNLTWILPLENRKLKLKPDLDDVAEYMRIEKNDVHMVSYDAIIIFADKPLTCLRDCSFIINMFVKFLIMTSTSERMLTQQEHMIYRITRYVRAPLIELFEGLDEVQLDELKIPQSSIIIGVDSQKKEQNLKSQNIKDQFSKEQKSKKNFEAVLDIANNLADIIDIAKIDIAKTKTVEVEIQIEDLIGEVIGIIKEKHTKISIITTIDPSVPPNLIGDDKKIKQILLNLWTNCVANLENEMRPSLSKKRGLSIEVSAILIDPKSEGIVTGSIDSQYYIVSFKINDFRSKELLKSIFTHNLSMLLTMKLVDFIGGNIDYCETLGGTTIIIELVLCVDKLYEVQYNTMRVAQHKQVLLIADDCDTDTVHTIRTTLEDHKVKYIFANTTLEATILYPDIIFDLYIAKNWNSDVSRHLPIHQYRDKTQILDMLKY